MAKISTDTTVTLYKFKCSCDREHGKEDWGDHCGTCGAKVRKVAAGQTVIGFTNSFCPCCHHRLVYPQDYMDSHRYYCQNCQDSYSLDLVGSFHRPRCQICGRESMPDWNKFCEGCGADMETALTFPDPKTLSWFRRNGVFVWLAIAIVSVLALVGGFIWLVVKVIG